jgi:tetratricopeptide (TPR) repeat protein
MLRLNGRFEESEQLYRRAVNLLEQLFKEFPDGLAQLGTLDKFHDDLAWVLAIRPDRQPQHTAEALQHAQKAVGMAPGYHDRWHTLGVAHCRTGHWKEALACFEKARRLENKPGPPSSFNRFFEAMAYSGLGDKERARRCYDEGVGWMQKHVPDHPDLRRFRDEAAQMLRIAGGAAR